MKVNAYKLLLEVSEGEITPEEAQIELLKLLDTVKLASPKIYSGQDIRNCKLAIYEVFWKSGGSSVASIGFTHDGTRWIAPTNWTYDESNNDSKPIYLIDDEMIDSIDYIELLYIQNR